MEWISQTQLAKLAGVSRQTINKFIKKNNIPKNEKGEIDLDSDEVRAELKMIEARKRAKIPNVVNGKKGGAPKKDSPLSPKDSEKDNDSLATALVEAQNRKTFLEVRKLEVGIEEKEMKNRVTRGELGDMKFLEMIFFSQLQFAIDQFLAFPESTIDDIIALVMEKGPSARTEAVNYENKIITKIGINTKRGWQRQIDQIKTRYQELSEQKRK